MDDEELVTVHFDGTIELTAAEVADAGSFGQAVQNLLGSAGACIENVYDDDGMPL